MTWTPRQRAILAEMGLSVWAPLPTSAPSVGSAVEGGRSLKVPEAVGVAAARMVTGRSKGSSSESLAPSRPVEPAVGGSAAPSADSAERPSGVERMDWVELQAAVSQCTACKLCHGRTQAVFGVGSVQAHWLVVGEAPGEQEDRQGEPFVGKSGQLLDNMLRAIQRTRHDTFSDGRSADAAHQVYIANAVKCRPPGNRNPEPAELVQCEPYLVRQIELLRPRIILAMGRFAVQSLLRSTEPIGRLRGRVHHYQGVPLVVTYHPAYLLRNPGDKAKAWDDLRLALRVVQGASAP